MQAFSCPVLRLHLALSQALYLPYLRLCSLLPWSGPWAVLQAQALLCFMPLLSGALPKFSNSSWYMFIHVMSDLFFNRKELPTTARLLFLFFCCNFYHCLDFILLWGAIRVQLPKSIIEFCISANHVHFLHSSVCFPTCLAVRLFFYITSTFQCCKIQWWHHCPPSFQHFTSERAAKQDHTVKGQYVRLLLFYTQLWTMSSDDILCEVQEAEEIWA